MIRWDIEQYSAEQYRQAWELSKKLNMSEILTMQLVRHGITTESNAKLFFRPQLPDLINPFRMKDMDIAVDRLNDAIGRKEHIMVYGDYDVDGVTAVTLVYKFLLQYYSNLEYYIPNRYDEGYGVSKKGIDYAKQRGVTLIIILDCGIKAHEEIAYARSLGIDFIICDHHFPDTDDKGDDILPPAVAILNPKQQADTYPFKHLCGCGIGFKFMQGFAKNNGIPFSKLIPLLDLCVISIASDLVNITDENRILAYHGLKQLNLKPSTGIQAIIETCGLNEQEITMNDIVFKIGPRINASGRMENGQLAVNLLVEKNLDKALELAKEIDEYNDQRREADKQMTEEANELVHALLDKEDSKLWASETPLSIVVYDETWKKGILGIVATRLAEDYFRPTIVFTREGDYAVGSARSVAGFDIYAAIRNCRELLVNFGGHTYACGLTIRWADVERFKTNFEKYVAGHISPTQTEPAIRIDAVINFSDINRRLLHDLKRFSPFGPGNMKPHFMTKEVYDFGTSKVVGRTQKHVKMELVASKSPTVVNGIAFGQAPLVKQIKSKQAFDIAYTIEENQYKKGFVQLQIDDIHFHTEG